MPLWHRLQYYTRSGRTFTTVELHINFLRPVWNAKLRAEARMVRVGKVVGLVECDVFDERRRLIARASGTCMILSGARGEDRALPMNLPRYLKETLNSPEQNPVSTEHSRESAATNSVLGTALVRIALVRSLYMQ